MPLSARRRAWRWFWVFSTGILIVPQPCRLQEINGRPNYNLGPVKLSAIMSVFWGWALIFLYIWAGPHHLHYTALPDWAQTLGMTFSIILWMPSWGGMINGLMTLSGAWDKL